MKKISNILLALLIIIFLCSFRNDDSNYELKITDSKFYLNSESVNYDYTLDKGYFFKLETNAKDSYQYRIILNDLYLIVLPNTTYGMLYGFNKKEDILICEELDATELNILLTKCDIFISLNNVLYNKLNSLLNKYLKLDYEERAKNKITLFSNSGTELNTFNLERATSSDEYLDGYEPREYDVVDSLNGNKGDDPIVNIVPKEWFFMEGNHNYVGQEYAIHMTTYLMRDVFYDYYKSDVMVIDFDFSNPNTSLNDIFVGDIEMGNHITDFTNNLIVDVVINDVYFGLLSEPDNIHYREINCNITYDRMVLHNLNFKELFKGVLPELRYVDLENIGCFIDAEKEDYSIYFKSVEMYLDINEYLDTVPSISSAETVNFISSISYDVFLQILSSIPGLGNITSMLDTFSIFNEAYNYLDDLTDVGLKSIAINPDSDSRYKFTLESSSNIDENTAIFSLFLPNFVEKLMALEAIDYSYIFKIQDKEEILDGRKVGLEETFHDRYLYIAYKICDEDGNVIFNNEDNKDYFVCNNYEYITYGKETYESNGVIYEENYLFSYSDLINLNFNIEYSGCEKVYLLKSDVSASINITHFLYSIPNNAYVRITDEYGRILATSESRNGNLPYILTRFETSTKDLPKHYFIVGGFTDGSTGSFSMTDVPITTIDFNNSVQNYRVTNNTNLIGYRFTNRSHYSIYSLFTISEIDPRIVVYNQFGSMIGYNDDDPYQPSDDYTEYDSVIDLPIGNDDSMYIIITNSQIPQYETCSVEFTVNRWSV